MDRGGAGTESSLGAGKARGAYLSRQAAQAPVAATPTHTGAAEMSARLKGKVVLVTGAASGIGLATARLCSDWDDRCRVGARR
jgi:NADPH:quinone reductase-like Zn-dependent oxidoreductase